MDALHSHPCPTEHRYQTRQRHYLVTRGRWNEPSPPTLQSSLAMTGIGLALLAGGIVTAFSPAAGPVVFLLVFLSSPFLLYGSILLLLASVEGLVHKVQRTRKHCGRCRFYQPFAGRYALGHCQSDPRKSVVRRTDGCPFFSYSERAMVRDRLAVVVRSED